MFVFFVSSGDALIIPTFVLPLFRVLGRPWTTGVFLTHAGSLCRIPLFLFFEVSPDNWCLLELQCSLSLSFGRGILDPCHHTWPVGRCPSPILQLVLLVEFLCK